MTLYLDKATDTKSDSWYAARTAVPFIIGSQNAGSGEDWSGLIDDVRLYNRALLPTEISRIYFDTTGGLGLISPRMPIVGSGVSPPIDTSKYFFIQGAAD